MTEISSAETGQRDVPAGQPQGSEPPAPGARAQELLEQHPWLAIASSLASLCVVAGAGAGLRMLTAPAAGIAAGAWILLTAILTARWYLKRRARAAGDPAWTAGAWRPGQPPLADVPAATMEAAGRILSAVPSRRWRGAWLQIDRCTDPVRHGRCQGAAAVPDGDAIRVRLGEHFAERPEVAAFTLAHEIRHPAGWTCHLSVAATQARAAGWLIAGWAVPWPWLPAALAIVQVAHAAAVWVTEIGCDLGAARAEGRRAGLELVAYGISLKRQPAPGRSWPSRIRRVVVIAAGLNPHPPLRLRRILIRRWPLLPAEELAASRRLGD